MFEHPPHLVASRRIRKERFALKPAPNEMEPDPGSLRHDPLGLVFVFRSVTQGYTLGWDTDQPFGLSETMTSVVTVSLLEAQRN